MGNKNCSTHSNNQDIEMGLRNSNSNQEPESDVTLIQNNNSIQTQNQEPNSNQLLVERNETENQDEDIENNNAPNRKLTLKQRLMIYFQIVINAFLPIIFYFEAASNFLSKNYYIGSFIVAIVLLLNICNMRRVCTFLKSEDNSTTKRKYLKATVIFVFHLPSSYLLYKSIRNKSDTLQDFCLLCKYSRVRMVTAPICALRIYTWLKGDYTYPTNSPTISSVLYIYNTYIIYIIVLGMTLGIINITSLVVNRYSDEINNKLLLKVILLMITVSRVHIIPMMLYMDLEWALGAMVLGVVIYLCIINIIEDGIFAKFIKKLKNAVSCSYSCGNGENSSMTSISTLIQRIKNKIYKLCPCLADNKLKVAILVFNIIITINCNYKWWFYVDSSDIGVFWYYYFFFFSSVVYIFGVIMFLKCFGLSRDNLIIVTEGKRNLIPLNVYQVV